MWITDLYYFEIDLNCVIYFYIQQLLGLNEVNEALRAGVWKSRKQESGIGTGMGTGTGTGTGTGNSNGTGTAM